MIPKFNNRPNDHIMYGFDSPSSQVKIRQDYFISRSVAVVGVVFAITTEGMHVLLTKRSHKMRDEAGKCSVPCGYLDWDESGYDAMRREVYEETSFDISAFNKQLIYDNNKQPFEVRDNPKANKRQNVSMLYVTVFDFTEYMTIFPLDVEGYSCKEVDWVSWGRLHTVLIPYEFKKKYKIDWAFNHDVTINSALKFYVENFKRL